MGACVSVCLSACACVSGSVHLRVCVVFLCAWAQSVAIKKISKKGRNAKAVEKIRNEIEVMRRVHHPNCIELHTVYELSLIHI